MRQLPLWAALAVALLAAPAAQAIWPFGESEEEKAADLATHVAETLREPNRTIAQAQDATEAGDTEEAIRLFRKAQSQIEAVEAAEDTSGSAWSALRLKKFQCISARDALALKRAEVMDVRQAVTDTDDLEARLAAERAEPPRSRLNGCMAGAGFCFLAHDGRLQPCGFYEADGGSVRDFACDLPAAYRASPLFARLKGGPVCLARAAAQTR